MQKNHLRTTLVLILGILLCNVQPALAFPPIPSGFYGTVKIDGTNVPSGTVISARINGVSYATTVVTDYNGSTAYSLDVPGDDPDSTGTLEGGVAGNTVIFFIGTRQADQTMVWRSGTNVYLNLTGSTTGNHAPVITEGDSIDISMCENGVTKPFGLTLHATDADGDTLTWAVLSPAGNGTATASGMGASMVVGYTPISGYVGPDIFYVQVSDSDGGTAMIKVNVAVQMYIFLPIIGR